MRFYGCLGERGRALEQYQYLIAVLRAGPGTVLGPETTALYEKLRRGEVEAEVVADLPEEAPPPRRVEASPNNLPLQPTPLVGREREVKDIVGQVRREGARLLTLTGPGGTGKTRVAVSAGEAVSEEFDNGVFFVPLAAINDPELVPSAIAGSLGVKESAEQPLVEILEDYLRHKRLLLILDSFEQVLGAGLLVKELVGTCPELKILVTSRIPLTLYGER
jgi:hypothetical protein